MFELLYKQVTINTEVISYLAELCIQPVEGDISEGTPDGGEAPRVDMASVPIPEVRLFGHEAPKKDIICFKCGIVGHYTTRCPSHNPNKCRRCEESGYLRLDCPPRP